MGQLWDSVKDSWRDSFLYGKCFSYIPVCNTLYLEFVAAKWKASMKQISRLWLQQLDQWQASQPSPKPHKKNNSTPRKYTIYFEKLLTITNTSPRIISNSVSFLSERTEFKCSSMECGTWRSRFKSELSNFVFYPASPPKMAILGVEVEYTEDFQKNLIIRKANHMR